MFVSRAFEEAARQYLTVLNRKRETPFDFLKIGSWWDRNEEIDIVAFDEKEIKFLFGECKWSSNPVGTDIYENLKRKSILLRQEYDIKENYYFIFSKSGFTEGLKKIKDEKLKLVSVDEMADI